MNDQPGNAQQDSNRNLLWILLAILVGGGFIVVACGSTIGLTFYGATNYQSTLNVRSTVTQAAWESQATTTQAANELLKFEFDERFTSNIHNWMTGVWDDQYFKGMLSVENGVYTWDIQDSKNGFSYNGRRSSGANLTLNNFDLSVKVKGNEEAANGPCYGLVFREADNLSDQSFYAYELCDNGEFAVMYFSYSEGSSENGWVALVGREYTAAYLPNDWNKLGVQARGDHLTFFLNDKKIAELDDDHAAAGEMGVFVDAARGQKGIVVFDYFYVHGR